MAPVAGGGGLTGLLGSFVNRRFWTNNPYNKEVRINLEVTLPPFLAQRGWQVIFHNPGGGSFTLPPRGSRKIRIGLKAGGEFTAAEVTQAGTQAAIVISAKINGYIFGGITYELDPSLKTPPIETPQGGGVHKDCTETAHRLLECLNLPYGEVKSVCIKKVTVDIELKNCDC